MVPFKESEKSIGEDLFSNLPNILSSNISLSPIFNCVLAVPMPVAFKTKLLI